MNVLFLMIPIAIALGFTFVYFFIWATKDGQFDDLDTPSVRILLEDSNINNQPNHKETGMSNE